MNVKANWLANKLWGTVTKTKKTEGKFTLNGFIHSYRRIAQGCYRIDECMSFYFLSDPINYLISMKTINKAEQAVEKAWQVYNKAFRAYGKSVSSVEKARLAWEKAWEAYEKVKTKSSL